MKFVFIFNPVAGRGGHDEILRQAIESSSEKDNCEFYVTRNRGDATAHVRNWCATHPTEPVQFIACGGDGTVNEVINGMVGAKNAVLSIYPCGSGNDLVKTFGGVNAFLNVDALLSAPTRKMDLFRIGDRYCGNVANFGFDTTVAVTVNTDREKRGYGSKRSYTKGILKAFVSSMSTVCTVIADGEVLNPDGELLLCTIANGQYVGGSFRCAPRAKTDDGIMDVCLVKPVSRVRVPFLIGKYARGEHLDEPSMQEIIEYRQAKSVEVIGEPGFTYTLDGEIIRSPRFVVEMEPLALTIAVPEQPSSESEFT
jgi:diacylglycerol kinase (ATP)